MGYQVDHSLEYIGHDPAFDAFLDVFKGRAEDAVAQIAGKSYLFYGEGVYEDEMDKAMHLVSKKFPTILFVVTTKWEQGMGGEVSKGYYRDGKTIRHKAELIFPEFKEEDLK